MASIPYGRQSITDADIEAVVEVLRSDFLTQGPQIEKFEAQLKSTFGANHAISVNSATSALHIAYLALGLGPGKELWTSPNTFVATANAALLCGAKVDFVDIDSTTYNIDPLRLSDKIKARRRKGQKGPDIVTMVHFAGQPCDVEDIRRLADEHGFWLVEDASHALGASWNGELVGSGRYADVTVFSFHPVKIITTGEGGAALTNNLEVANSMRALRTHGIIRDPVLFEENTEGTWYYEQKMLGLNYRMTDIQAALGISQMKRLGLFIDRRRYLANRYDAELRSLPLLLPRQAPAAASSYHLYPVLIEKEHITGGRRAVYDRLRAQKIFVQVHYIPVHLQPYYKARGFRAGDFPNAENYYSKTISLPIYPALEESQQNFVVENLKNICADLTSC